MSAIVDIRRLKVKACQSPLSRHLERLGEYRGLLLLATVSSYLHLEQGLAASVPPRGPLHSSHVSLESFRINFNHFGRSVCPSHRSLCLFHY